MGWRRGKSGQATAATSTTTTTNGVPAVGKLEWAHIPVTALFNHAIRLALCDDMARALESGTHVPPRAGRLDSNSKSSRGRGAKTVKGEEDGDEENGEGETGQAVTMAQSLKESSTKSSAMNALCALEDAGFTRMTNSLHRTMQKPPSATASRRSTRDKSSTSSSSKEGAKSKSKDSHSKPDIKGYLRLPYPFVKAETVRLLEKLYSAGYRGKKDEAWGRIITGALWNEEMRKMGVESSELESSETVEVQGEEEESHNSRPRKRSKTTKTSSPPPQSPSLPSPPPAVRGPATRSRVVSAPAVNGATLAAVANPSSRSKPTTQLWMKTRRASTTDASISASVSSSGLTSVLRGKRKLDEYDRDGSVSSGSSLKRRKSVTWEDLQRKTPPLVAFVLLPRLSSLWGKASSASALLLGEQQAMDVNMVDDEPESEDETFPSNSFGNPVIPLTNSRPLDVPLSDENQVIIPASDFELNATRTPSPTLSLSHSPPPPFSVDMEVDIDVMPYLPDPQTISTSGIRSTLASEDEMEMDTAAQTSASDRVEREVGDHRREETPLFIPYPPLAESAESAQSTLDVDATTCDDKEEKGLVENEDSQGEDLVDDLRLVATTPPIQSTTPILAEATPEIHDARGKRASEDEVATEPANSARNSSPVPSETGGLPIVGDASASEEPPTGVEVNADVHDDTDQQHQSPARLETEILNPQVYQEAYMVSSAESIEPTAAIESASQAQAELPSKAESVASQGTDLVATIENTDLAEHANNVADLHGQSQSESAVLAPLVSAADLVDVAQASERIVEEANDARSPSQLPARAGDDDTTVTPTQLVDAMIVTEEVDAQQNGAVDAEGELVEDDEASRTSAMSATTPFTDIPHEKEESVGTSVVEEEDAPIDTEMPIKLLSRSPPSNVQPLNSVDRGEGTECIEDLHIPTHSQPQPSPQLAFHTPFRNIDMSVDDLDEYGSEVEDLEGGARSSEVEDDNMEGENRLLDQVEDSNPEMREHEVEKIEDGGGDGVQTGTGAADISCERGMDDAVDPPGYLDGDVEMQEPDIIEKVDAAWSLLAAPVSVTQPGQLYGDDRHAVEAGTDVDRYPQEEAIEDGQFEGIDAAHGVNGMQNGNPLIHAEDATASSDVILEEWTTLHSCSPTANPLSTSATSHHSNNSPNGAHTSIHTGSNATSTLGEATAFTQSLAESYEQDAEGEVDPSPPLLHQAT